MNSSANDLRCSHVVQSLTRYWQGNSALVAALPVPVVEEPACQILPPRMALVVLPEWATDLAPDGGLLVPEHCVTPGDGPDWERVDWWLAADWFLNGTAERAFEELHGPIHSYAFRLRDWDSRLWSRAWVNRMALFLRRWAARQKNADETILFGVLPLAEIRVTHDIDAVEKTLPIRIKQTAFHGFNAARSILSSQPAEGWRRVMKVLRMGFGTGRDWSIDATIQIEKQFGVRSHLNLFAGHMAAFSPKRWLLDPSYNILEPALAHRFAALAEQGWILGLHQSYDAWSDAARMREEKTRLERATGVPVVACRQHWLRFSWKDTWAAQAAAGLKMDSTLGFNDRPGFRNGAALCYQPRASNGGGLGISTLPLVLMDSQLYDYARLSPESMAAGIRKWIGEIKAVGGQASVLWHPHTLSMDYGWEAGFIELLKAITE